MHLHIAMGFRDIRLSQLTETRRDVIEENLRQ